MADFFIRKINDQNHKYGCKSNSEKYEGIEGR
jgi:hypothetical protein